ncbi:MAG: 50S ribosomal protein L15 [Erysipelotrichaceae bacterium]|jgi:large subunit ribosomal protein L15|nr:50S ribosomal protein L15 [Erysipelotrichaceae bacterium]MBR6254381.1 50S ribosomal protein L15 [Clostridiales bacterium]MBQ1810773.1 50S ribosomal protein L15 [Erysipelotrichaceae bacterium]MBR3150896.1 50S ribosomal protein L15 [Erysipelotrichaceae bacterium]MBR3167383.1 50S ribosomal protein L15 [Erysipelotrichaceae bacterium]
MNLEELKANPGARRNVKRIGRGQGSGNGKTAGKGQKGQLSRSGGGKGPGFEGGQTPIYKSIPKRGFTNISRKEYAIVNLSDLNRFEDGVTVTPELLKECGLIKKELAGIKVLGNGTLEKKVSVVCHKISSSAKEAIEKAGGKVEVL